MYDMKEPSDDVQFTLEQIARRLNARVPGVPSLSYRTSVRYVPCGILYASCTVLSYAALSHSLSLSHPPPHTHTHVLKVETGTC